MHIEAGRAIAALMTAAASVEPIREPPRHFWCSST